MKLGMVGLGRMGMNMARRLLRDGHHVVAWNRTEAKLGLLEREGGEASSSLEDLVSRLTPPRVVWLMLPAGDVVESHLRRLAVLMDPGDVLVDGGNSYFRDDIRRANWLADRGVGFLDVGLAGGIWGLEMGYSIMVGGDVEAFRLVEPAIQSLAPRGGYLHCGHTGAGHYVKMIHNGVECALMEAYGEGFEILRRSPYADGLQLREVAAVWNRGSVVRSWLLELLERALKVDPLLETVAGYVEDSGAGRWTVSQALESGVSAVGIAHAVMKRFQSRQDEVFSDKVLAALRREFGAHPSDRPRRLGGAGGRGAPQPARDQGRRW